MQANANLKADTTDVLLGRKKRMHMDAFKYRMAEIAEQLQVTLHPLQLNYFEVCLVPGLLPCLFPTNSSHELLTLKCKG
jgi:hypothetical protein